MLDDLIEDVSEEKRAAVIDWYSSVFEGMLKVESGVMPGRGISLMEKVFFFEGRIENLDGT